MPNVYNRAKKRILSGELVLGAATLRALLVGPAYVFDPDQDFVSAVTANELSGGGYARQTLSGVAFLEDDAGDRGRAQAAKVTFPSIASGQTIAGAIVFASSGLDSTSDLVAFYSIPATPTDGSIPELVFDGQDPGDFLRGI